MSVSAIGHMLISMKSWRWLPGMKTLTGDRVKMITDHGEIILDRGYVTLDDKGNWCVQYSKIDVGELPDLRDAPTVGAVLDLIYRCTGKTSYLYFDENTWELRLVDNPASETALVKSYPRGTSQGEALVNALDELEGEIQ